MINVEGRESADVADVHVLIGRIERPHGLRGEVRVRLFTDDPESYVKRKHFFGIGDRGELYTLPVTASRIHQDVLLVIFEGVQDRNQAELLRGQELFIKRSEMPLPGHDEYYFIDLVGLHVRVIRGGCDREDTAGTVVSAFNNGSHGVLELKLNERTATVFVPFINEAVPDVNLAEGRVSVHEEFIV